MGVILDHSYICNSHNNDINKAVSRLRESMEVVNSIFRTTDFDEDGIPDNIGFEIKQIIIIQTSKAPFNLMPSHSPHPVDIYKFIAAFSQYRFLHGLCVGVLFTYQAFEDKVLGMSFTGNTYS